MKDNQYCSLWAVKVFRNATPIKAGDVIPVRTKAGKDKTETVLCVISQGVEEGENYTLCAVQPKERGTK